MGNTAARQKEEDRKRMQKILKSLHPGCMVEQKKRNEWQN